MDWILPKSENLGRRHLDAFYLKLNFAGSGARH